MVTLPARPRRAPDRPVDRRADADAHRPPTALPRPTARQVTLAVGLLWVSVSAVAYALDPRHLGGQLYMATSLVSILAITIGPLARGARPRRIWLPQSMAGMCLLLSLLSEVITVNLGPITFADLTYFSGYVLFIVWLSLLARYLGRPDDRLPLFDSIGAASAVVVALWTTTLSPLVGGSRLPDGLVWAVYPTMDVVLLALSAHLAMQFDVVPVAIKWLVPTLVGQLTLDTVFSLSNILAAPAVKTATLPFYLFSFYGLAAASTHRSIGAIRPALTRCRARRGGRVTLTFSPAILATAIPVSGSLDTVVSTSLVAVLLAVLAARLSRTMTALARAESESHHRATHDQLTGLLNRAALIDTLAHMLDRNGRDGRLTAVFFFDCDDFKHVNDTGGHDAGDTLLRDIATRLPATLTPTALLARHGGDEFVVLESADGREHVMELAERIQAFFDEPLRILPGRRHTVTSSLGIAVADPRERGETATTQTLLGKADVAMYEAKQSGRGRCVVYDAVLAWRRRTRNRVADRLGQAVRDGAFTLQLQPIMGGDHYERLVGWEALARWHDPELGEVSPDVFVPRAEQLGLINRLGEVVLRRACVELAQLRASLGDDVAVSFNVSTSQLLELDFVNVVRDALDAADLPGRCLRLEVTESMLVHEGPSVRATLSALQAAGVSVCIDDFGTGYASLATLLRLPIDCVKIDKSLVGRLGVHAQAPRQLRAVLDLVQSLGIEQVIAEGVETVEQADVLLALGCPMAQGWLYGRPATTESLLVVHDLPGPGGPGVARGAHGIDVS